MTERLMRRSFACLAELSFNVRFDLQLRLQMHEELKRIHRAIGSTFILVTHDQSEAITLSDRIAVMNGGRIVQLGAPNDIYYRPNSRFVASFVGHANFISGEVISASEGQAELASGALKLKGITTTPLSKGTKATGVLRYEHVRLVSSNSGKGLSGTVTEVSFQGSTYRVIVKLESGATIIAEKSGDSVERPFAAGEQICVDWSDSNFAIFADS